MAFKFDCSNCGSPIVVRFLKPGEKAWCKNCGSETVVPETAAVIEEGPMTTIDKLETIPSARSDSASTVNNEEATSLRPLTPFTKLLSLTLDKFADNKRIFLTFAAIYYFVSVLSDIPRLPILFGRNLKPLLFLSSVIDITFLIILMLFEIPVIIVSYSSVGFIKIREYFKQALPLIIPFFITSLIFFLALLLSAVCLIIPAIIIFVWFNFAIYYVIIERKYYFKAMAASKNLVKNRWWKVFARILLPNLIAMFIGGVTAFLTPGIIRTGSNLLGLLFFIIMSSFSTMAMLFVTIFEVTLFKDLKGEEFSPSIVAAQEKPS